MWRSVAEYDAPHTMSCARQLEAVLPDGVFPETHRPKALLARRRSQVPPPRALFIARLPTTYLADPARSLVHRDGRAARRTPQTSRDPRGFDSETSITSQTRDAYGTLRYSRALQRGWNHLVPKIVSCSNGNR